jgi:2-amino-1-hydroxyethylphosphonate dioxygenase (glycine-forming)
MTTPETKVDNIIQIYHIKGGNDYDIEDITQEQHALQAAKAAKEKGYDKEIQIAALLHDIGHMCESDDRMGDLGVVDHEHVGADYLTEIGFSEKVVALVRSHVKTKRYLTAVDVTYKAKLSESSKKTMEYQGGPMTKVEIEEFENDKYFNDYVRFRELDELAKVVGMKTRTFKSYRGMMIELLN